MLEQGFEGIIIKDADGEYQWHSRIGGKRDRAWTKRKPVDTFDARIVGFYAGKEGKRLEGTLGGVCVEGVDENNVPFECKVGGGWSDPLRDKIWNNQEDYLGKMIEIEADPNVLEMEGRDVNSLRWGVYKKFRPDKE